MLDSITPLVITYDEEPNIERTLRALAWARDIVVVDSGSRDGTRALLDADPRVRTFERAFDTFARQCSYGAELVETPWVLSLDADHVVSPELVEELRRLEPGDDIHAYVAPFRYHVHGRPLRGSLYPPRVVLFRRDAGRFVDDGHGHTIEIEGVTRTLRGEIAHDDRKPLRRFITSQNGYMRKEAEKLLQTPAAELTPPDRLRRWMVVAPFAVLVYCLFLKRGILDGAAGWHYAFQRMLAELILSLHLLDRRLMRRAGDPAETGE